MYKSSLCKVLVLAGALFLPACATVTRGPNVEFHIATEPPGAAVTTNLETSAMREEVRRQKRLIRYGVINEEDAVPLAAEYYGCAPTPCSIKIGRRSEFTATVSLPGYHPASVEITSGFGKGGSGKAAGGAAVSATGGYVVTYATTAAALAPFAAFGASSAVSSAASSAATSAATGIGISFLAVDVLSGAMLDVRPNPLVLVLVPETEPVPDGPNVVIETAEELEAVLGAQHGPES